MRRSLASSVLLVAACATVPPPQPSGDATASTSETTLTLPDGATVPVPPGWTRQEFPPFTHFREPDGGLTVRLLPLAADHTANAIDEAWRSAAESPPALDKDVSPPPPPGWDELQQRTYKQPPDAARLKLAVAFRKAGRAWVWLVDASMDALGRRGQQLTTMILGLKAPGVVVEDFSAHVAKPFDDAMAATFTAYLEELRAEYRIPSLAVAVVQDGKPVFSRGFGTTRATDGAPVTPKTLFLIGSVTKGMTSFVHAKLVEEGLLTWDTPLVDLAPTFRLSDPEVTRKVTLRHSTCACTGLPRRDVELLFDYGTMTPERVLTSLADVKPTTGFGETFQYSNQLVAIGGYAAARKVLPDLPMDAGYAELLRTRFFVPLGMTSSTTDFAAGLAAPHAEPHATAPDGERLPFAMDAERFVVPYLPAGGVWSNLEDMSRYALMELGHGVMPDGTRVLSDAAMDVRRAPMVKTGSDTAYALGLSVGKNRGLDFVTHGGGTFGFSTHYVVMPGKQLGLVILSNGGGETFGLIQARLVELVLGADLKVADRRKFQHEQTIDAWKHGYDGIDRKPNADWMQRLAGKWTHARIGELVITGADGVFTLDAGEWKSRLGRRTVDGADNLVLLDPPLVGLQLRVKERDGRPLIVIETDPQSPTELVHAP